jgi:Ca-activated chloride channel family protein
MITPRVTHRLALFVALALASVACASEAPDPLEPTDERSLAPYFFVRGGDDGVDRLPLLDTDVQVDIAGVIAHVTVKQTYKNDGTRPIHARYVFPASTRAAVHGLRLTVGDQVVRAQIREREQAPARVQRPRKAAGMPPYSSSNGRTCSRWISRTAATPARDRGADYSELLVPTDGEYEFVYPTVVGPRLALPAAALPRARPGSSHRYFRARRAAVVLAGLSAALAAGMPSVSWRARRTHPPSGATPPVPTSGLGRTSSRVATATSSFATGCRETSFSRGCCFIRGRRKTSSS